MLVDSLRRSAERDSTKPALVLGAEGLSYPELYEFSGQLANGLAAAGIASGDRVVLLLRNRLEFAVAFYGITGIGGAAVLLDPASRSHELAHACRDCDPGAIIADPEGITRWRDATGHVRSMDFTLVAGHEGDADGFWSVVREHPMTRAWESDGDQVATYQYSSGSTGRAKRIGRTHAQWAFEAGAFAVAATFGPDDVFLCVAPLFHAYGLGGFVTAVEVGATTVLQERVHPFALHRLETLELVRSRSATVLQAVPYMFDLLARAPDREPLPSLRHCGSSGAPLREETFREFDRRFGIAIRQEYGSTEAGKIAVNVDPDPRPRSASVGTALPGIELLVLSEDGTPAPAGTTGPVAIKSPGLTTDHPYEGIRDSPFVGDLFLTGDVGQLDADGRLTVTGRTKIFFDVLGEKVDPTEVEEVLAGHACVKESVVVGVDLATPGTLVLKAVVVLDSPCEKQELIDFCKQRLSSFKVPSIVEFREEIPRSQIGKILRKDLIP